MIPDDERLSRAMHRLEQEMTDAPGLFERVGEGVRRRRRRVASGTAMAGAAAVVAVIAIVPALTGGSATHRTSTAAGPGVSTAAAPAGSSLPNPSTVIATTSLAPPVRVQPLSSPPSAPSSLPPAPTPLPTNAQGCPTVDSLPPGPDAETQARAAALAAVPKRYGAANAAKANVTSVYAAATGHGYGIVADAICGKALGDNSYVVELGFGGNSASVGNGQLFVANFAGGWQVWFQYH